jgi:hypothetical protein
MFAQSSDRMPVLPTVLRDPAAGRRRRHDRADLQGHTQPLAIVAPEAAQSMLQLPRLYLWRDGQLVYRSVDAQPEFRATVTGSLADTARE